MRSAAQPRRDTIRWWSSTGVDSASSSKPPTSPSRLQGVDAQKLLGRDVRNAQDDKVGEIKQLDQDGVVSAVIVSVGGFLGIDGREMALAWKGIAVADNGEKVNGTDQGAASGTAAVSLCRAQEARTAFRNDPAETKPSTAAPLTTTPTTTPAPTTPQASSVLRAGLTPGDVSGAGYARATVRNPAGETIGTVDETFLSPEGAVKA